MAGSFNRITIVGNLGRDPEVRYLPSGETVADFSVATTERRRSADGSTQETTTWFRVSAFGRLSEVAHQYLRKGGYVYVDGALTQREYTDRDGHPRQSLDVRARELRMLDRRDESAAGVAPDTALVGAGAGAPTGDTADLPF